MSRGLDRDEVQQLAASGAQLVEALPTKEYRWRHIAGAQHLPLAGLTREKAETLDASRPVIVYCNDFQ
ncbi:MAG: rhodanese-like domain-containing protein [Candidatus Dormibacteraeota bacterium]|nr:rhodanese-like domain-containing protein [Candidatus Dormibacteraeota bacterium]